MHNKNIYFTNYLSQSLDRTQNSSCSWYTKYQLHEIGRGTQYLLANEQRERQKWEWETKITWDANRLNNSTRLMGTIVSVIYLHSIPLTTTIKRKAKKKKKKIWLRAAHTRSRREYCVSFLLWAFVFSSSFGATAAATAVSLHSAPHICEYVVIYACVEYKSMCLSCFSFYVMLRPLGIHAYSGWSAFNCSRTEYTRPSFEHMNGMRSFRYVYFAGYSNVQWAWMGDQMLHAISFLFATQSNSLSRSVFQSFVRLIPVSWLWNGRRNCRSFRGPV